MQSLEFGATVGITELYGNISLRDFSGLQREV